MPLGPPPWANAISIIVAMPINFVINKVWTFRKRNPDDVVVGQPHLVRDARDPVQVRGRDADLGERGQLADGLLIRTLVRRGRRFLSEALPVIEAKRLMSTLKQSTLRDAMTGLHNRRFLEEYADTLVASAARRKAPVGLVMCDLDYFKEVNDSHGHDVGDAVLKQTAAIIQRAVRGADIAVRYGGEEFLVVLTDTVTEGPLLVAERIRKAVEAERFAPQQGGIKKTISLGVAELGTDTKSFWQAVKFADVALYKAKEGGRNRVMRFERAMWQADEY